MILNDNRRSKADENNESKNIRFFFQRLHNILAFWRTLLPSTGFFFALPMLATLSAVVLLNVSIVRLEEMQF